MTGIGTGASLAGATLMANGETAVVIELGASLGGVVVFGITFLAKKGGSVVKGPSAGAAFVKNGGTVITGSAFGCVVNRATGLGTPLGTSMFGATVGTLEFPPTAVGAIGILLILGANDTIPFVGMIDVVLGLADGCDEDIFDCCRIEVTLEFPDMQDDSRPSLEYTKHDVSRVVSFLQLMAKECPAAKFPFASSSITAPVEFSLV